MRVMRIDVLHLHRRDVGQIRPRLPMIAGEIRATAPAATLPNPA